jgi:hypothetical protein
MPADASPAATVTPLSCPSCGGTVELRAAGYTMSVVCQYCTSVLDVSDPVVKLVVEHHEAAAALDIPLGTRATLRGVEWDVVGYMGRSVGGAWPWEEYLLFNPYHGYRFLTGDGRGFSLGEVQTAAPSGVSAGGLEFRGDSYAPFFRNGRAQVDYVLGEFYWRVQVGETVETDDWVRPGFMLSRERNANEVSWTVSELLDPAELRDAFGLEVPRRPWPPLPHQPSPHLRFIKAALPVCLAALGFLLLLSILFTGSTRLISTQVAVASDGRDQEAAIGPFELKRPYQKVVIRSRVPDLENGWVDLDYALVDRKTQATYAAYKAAERYSGRDSEGSWTEGSRGATAQIASVPAGRYDLIIEYKGNRWDGAQDFGDWRASGASPIMAIEVDSAAVFGGNLVVALLLVALPIVVSFFRHVRFEQARQGESDVGLTGVAKMFESDEDDD